MEKPTRDVNRINEDFAVTSRFEELDWYAVSTKANHERHVEQNIKRLGIECFLPLLQEHKIVRRQPKTVIGPLFPGYLFVRIDLSKHYRAVIYTRGVRKIVEFGSIPVKVDAAMIDIIKNKTKDAKMFVREEAKELRNGQLVQIMDGPLIGFEAVFVRKMPGRQRAIVLLHALALRARAVVDIGQLSPYVAA
ncbi:MAG: hypothetical protein H8K04_05195 [Nitrospira sp.]